MSLELAVNKRETRETYTVGWRKTEGNKEDS